MENDKVRKVIRKILVTLVIAFGITSVSIAAEGIWTDTYEWTVYNTANSELPYNGIVQLAIDGEGKLWIGTGRWNAWAGGGLAKFDGENWTVYNTANSGLPHNDHTGLSIDPQGNIWSATEGGLVKFDGQNWTVYNTSNSGLPVNLVASPSFDAQGNLWVGSWGGGLSKFDGSNWTVYNTSNSDLVNNRPWGTYFDVEGNLWIGANGGGLVKFNATSWNVYLTSNSGLPSNVVGPMCFDSEGGLWIGTDGGLTRFDGQNWTVYDKSNSGLPHNLVNDLEIDNQGNLWIGTGGGGLAMFNGRQWIVFNTDNSDLPDNMVYSMALDHNRQDIWVGTQDGGLALYRPGERVPVIDFNGDGRVAIDDLLRLIESWGENDPDTDIAPQPFGDDIVDGSDLELFMSYWGQEVPDPTLLAHWKLDETEGIRALDSAGENDGIVLDSPLWQPEGGRINGALEFDGMDDVILAEYVLNPEEGPFSVFAWIKGGAPGQVVLAQQTGVNWLQVDTDGTLMTELRTAGGRRAGAPLYSETVITDGNWHRIGFVWDGAQRMLYVDDVPVALDSQNDLAGASGGLVLGAGADNQPGSFWCGMIDDVRIYDRVVVP